MEKYLKPERLDIDPSTVGATDLWTHWKKTFDNFVTLVPSGTEANKLHLLVNFVAPNVYKNISHCDNFSTAMAALEEIYIKPKSEVYSRYLLSSRKQENGESLDQYLQALRQLGKDCNFENLTAAEHRDVFIRDSFITGLSSPYIRQRLLENRNLTLTVAYEQARSLETAQRQSESYSQSGLAAAVPRAVSRSDGCLEDKEKYVDELPHDSSSQERDAVHLAATKTPFIKSTESCFFCGGGRHPRAKCPAKDAACKKCNKQGHFARVCKSRFSVNKDTCSSLSAATLVSISAADSAASYTAANCAIPANLKRAFINIKVCDTSARALVDSGSSDSFISDCFAEILGIKIYPSSKQVTLATTSSSVCAGGYVTVTLAYYKHVIKNVKLTILKNLCADVILGHDVLSKHAKLELHFGGHLPPLEICSVAIANVDPPYLFSNLHPNVKPIADKSRNYSREDAAFIKAEVQKLLKEGTIEPSKSPWRAQVLVVGRPKKRMVVDYSRTINRFTQLDAYPLPKMSELVRKIANYNVYSTLDLQSAYHQAPIREHEKKYTGFEADGKLYQFRVIPFGVTNGVAGFQRVIDSIISAENLEDTFAYVDNITICGNTQREHDSNLKSFYDAASKYNLTFNHDKSIISTDCIKLLGYVIKPGSLSPDPDRFEVLKNIPLPLNKASLDRVLGFFSYYSKWIPRFSETVYPLTHSIFPLSAEAQESFHKLKKIIEGASLVAINEDLPLEVETDASEYAISAVLSQLGKPVAFFSRTLNKSELKHSSIEKEAYAIVESVKKWRHLLLGRHFKLVTDQKCVSFMFDTKISSKIKNEKIQRWRIELACFSYDIVYRAGKLNYGADMLSRCSSVSNVCDRDKLLKIHSSLCHPGVVRMYHFVKSKNLPYSVSDVRAMISQCNICCKVKPNFFKPRDAQLIKATQPFERLSIDFKGPLPTVSRNKYMLTVVDEFSRFPFAFPCPDISTNTVIQCLTQLFVLFGLPSYVHCDRATSFMSDCFKNFLSSKGVAGSHSTPYNPTGNSQVERYNGIIWKAVTLSLEDQQLPSSRWEIVLPDVLHSIRSLLSTATNETPHERFFKHPRRSMTGQTLPKWLMTPGTVLMKRHVRASKYEPLVDEVELLHSNIDYAHVRLPNGRESTVSTKHLAPTGDAAMKMEGVSGDNLETLPLVSDDDGALTDVVDNLETTGIEPSKIVSAPSAPALRKSTRTSKPPDRLGYN